jgi:hypothetical protein
MSIRHAALALAAALTAGTAACSSAIAAAPAASQTPPPAVSSPAFPPGATQACQAAGGYLAWSLSGAPMCAQIGYLGSDGQTYYLAVTVSSDGALDGPADTQGTGATEHECDSGWYPDLDGAGPGQGPRGVWNRQLALCLPAGWQR